MHTVIRRVLTERGLDAEVSRIGLDTPGRPAAAATSPINEVAAIDLVRCLVRRPDILVVERALDGLPGATPRTPSSGACAARSSGAVLSSSLPIFRPAWTSPPFDVVMRFERGVTA